MTISYQQILNADTSINPNVILRLPDNVNIPNDENNRDWIEYQAWLALGNKPDPAPLAQRQSFCMNNLYNMRINKNAGGCTVSGNTYSTDSSSIDLMNQALATSERGFPVFPANWILLNGSTIQVTYDQLKAVSGAIASKFQTNFNNYVYLAAQINQSSNPESIDITQGWV